MIIVCSVKDRASELFGRPFFVPSIGHAIRGFTDEINRSAEDNQMFKHPDDFDLYHIGEFEEDTGRLVPVANPIKIADGKNVRIANAS